MFCRCLYKCVHGSSAVKKKAVVIQTWVFAPRKCIMRCAHCQINSVRDAPIMSAAAFTTPPPNLTGADRGTGGDAAAASTIANETETTAEIDRIQYTQIKSKPDAASPTTYSPWFSLVMFCPRYKWNGKEEEEKRSSSVVMSLTSCRACLLYTSPSPRD